MKIPDDVYSTRCRYCIHNRPDAENKEIPDGNLFSYYWTKDAPCKIIGISKCDKVPGECLSFSPNPMFGICQYCDFNNHFHDGYCTFPGGPVNKRRVFLGWGADGSKNDYWIEHALFTCDHYHVSSYWKGIIMRGVLNGVAPANFDPDTWEPLDRLEGTPATRKWSQLQSDEHTSKAAKAETVKRAEITTKLSDNNEQLSLFETGEDNEEKT